MISNWRDNPVLLGFAGVVIFFLFWELAARTGFVDPRGQFPAPRSR